MIHDVLHRQLAVQHALPHLCNRRKGVFERELQALENGEPGKAWFYDGIRRRRPATKRRRLNFGSLFMRPAMPRSR
jgi:hypothetical protein